MNFLTQTAAADHSCIFCGGSQPSYKCNKPLTLDERKEAITQNNACNRCLRRNHMAKNYNSKMKNCPECNGRHYAIVCPRSRQESAQSEGERSDEQPRATLIGNISNVLCDILLQTAYVRASVGDLSRTCRVILDGGAQTSYASSGLLKFLGSKPFKKQSFSTLTIEGSISKDQQYNVHKITLRSRYSDEKMETECVEVATVTQGIAPPAANLVPPRFKPIADFNDSGCSPVLEILLGADSLSSVHKGRIKASKQQRHFN